MAMCPSVTPFLLYFFFPKPVSVSVSVLNSFVPTRLSKDARLLRKKTQSKGKRDFNKIYFIAKLFFTKLRAPAKRAKCKLLVRAPSQNTWRRLFAVKTPAACADARSVSEQHLTLVLIQPSPKNYYLLSSQKKKLFTNYYNVVTS
jgi:hypothetical protein